MRAESELKGTSAGDEAVILDGVLDGPQTVARGILDLVDRVLVGALDEDGARVRVAAVFDKRVLFLAKSLFVHGARVAQHVLGEVIDRVDALAATRLAEALEVALLAATQTHDTLLCEHVERQGVDTLLIDDNKRLAVAVAHLAFELDNLLNLVIDEPAFTLDKLLALVSVGVVEVGRHLGLGVLKIEVQDKDMRILDRLRHVWMPHAMIQHQTPNKLRRQIALVLHMHELYHEQVNGHLGGFVIDAKNGIHTHIAQMIRELLVQLGAERRARDAVKFLPINVARAHFARLQVLGRHFL
mmetsp:Transcript_23433/g.34373  ORF Transcript_23433/g.34373 Transcript_23433/m.34373 type:complete len:299 (+) Transcript_23433:485-1381(+)